jgi:gliding motility-associated-like protein
MLMFCARAQGQLILNEFSQGSSGNKEYMEFVVTGTKTCTDSTADLRGWIVDDQNGWYGGLGTGISPGHFRFAITANWQKIPFGSIILLYNAADKNGSILLPDDPTDANNDNLYIVPHNSPFIEVHNAQPSSPSSPTFSYPAAGYTTTGVNDWPLRSGLNNTSDAIIITKPTARNTAYFSIAYGLTISPPLQIPHVALNAPVGADKNCFLNGDQYLLPAGWVTGEVPGNETPGAPNTAANGAWISSLRSSPPPIPVTFINACVSEGQAYHFNGQLITATGHYTTVYSSVEQCDSIVKLYVVVGSTRAQTVSGCGSVVFNGVTYGAPATVRDTIKSFASGCDSIYRVTNIVVHPITPTYTTACIKAGETYNFNGLPLTTGGHYVTAYNRPPLCDSIVHLYLTVSTTVSATITGCGVVSHNGVSYFSNGVLRDTVWSALSGCDSIYRITTLQVNTVPVVTVSPDVVICKGAPVKLTATAPGSNIRWINAGSGSSITVAPANATIYTAIATDVYGCSDTGYVRVTIEDFSLSLSANTNPVVIGDPVTLQTASSLPYQVLSWKPSALFGNQTSYHQQITPPFSAEVMVTGKTGIGCMDTARLHLMVLVNGLHVPAAFTPNKDGKNDLLQVIGTNVKKIDFKLFNRWGALMFMTRDPAEGWDGRYKGVLQPAGVYVYLLSAVMQDGTIVNKKGTVMLLY